MSLVRRDNVMDDPVAASAKAVEATAKAAGQVLEIVHDAGGYLREVFGELPTDLVGVVGGAWLHERHIRLRDALRRRTEQILRERDIQEARELSPNVAAALISGAQEEGRPELMELWARLLANAMDPSMNTVRHSFIEAVRKMDPMDAIVLRYLYEAKMTVVRRGRAPDPITNQTTGIENISTEIGRRKDEIEVSLRHLKDLSFFDYAHPSDPTAWYLNATSREFLWACYPEV